MHMHDEDGNGEEAQFLDWVDAMIEADDWENGTYSRWVWEDDGLHPHLRTFTL